MEFADAGEGCEVFGHEVFVGGEIRYGDKDLVVGCAEHAAGFDDFVEGGQGGLECLDGGFRLVGEVDLDVYFEASAE